MMRSKNKIHRQKAWIDRKRDESRTKREARFARRREETKNPELRARRLARNKPITIEDKRVWAEEDGEEEEEEEEEENPKQSDSEKPREKAPKSASDDDDLEDWLGDSSDEEDEDDKEDLNTPPKPTPKKSHRSSASDLPSKFAESLPPPVAEPRILITTSRHSTLHRQAEELAGLFPNSTYIPRSRHRFSYDFSIREISRFAANRGYTALVVLEEDQKKPHGLAVTMLPSGPMFHFSIKTWIDGKVIPGHGRATDHVPELVLNNFCTPLGRLIGGVFQRLFPQQPDLEGRQVVTIHNQRDFCFVRRHRYIFRDKRETERSVVDTDGRPVPGVENIRVGLQEIGPRITLKLRRVDKGIQRSSGVEWEWKAGMEKKRTVFQL